MGTTDDGTQHFNEGRAGKQNHFTPAQKLNYLAELPYATTTTLNVEKGRNHENVWCHIR